MIGSLQYAETFLDLEFRQTRSWSISKKTEASLSQSLQSDFQILGSGLRPVYEDVHM